MTEEEVMTSIARGELRSYKQLPQIWYQIQGKFRDEPRPKSGLMRVRRFTMKDSYSFDIDPAGLDVSYQKHHDAYCRILDRCGLKYLPVEAHSGAMGGSQSHEFAVPSTAGEDVIVVCESCGYKANLEKARAVAKPPAQPDPDGEAPPELFPTPGRKTIAEVAEFDGLPETSHIKTLLMVAGERRVMLLLRGDHQLNEAKLSTVLETSNLRPAHPEELHDWLGADAGSLGPVGASGLEMFADEALQGRRNMIAGANKDDFHLRNVTPGRDFQARFADLREVQEGDGCINDPAHAVKCLKCIEVGHIFKLGYRYSQSMGLRVLDANGKEVTPIMGSYGLGLERVLTAAIEQGSDEAGIVLPAPIAPFAVVVTPVNIKQDELREAAEQIYRECLELGIDALLDDRQERAGVKFNDAELIGIPYRVTVGKKISDGVVEIVERSTRESADAKLTEAPKLLKQKLEQSLDKA
jgi:prolyl-tRNA synthetase